MGNADKLVTPGSVRRVCFYSNNGVLATEHFAATLAARSSGSWLMYNFWLNLVVPRATLNVMKVTKTIAKCSMRAEHCLSRKQFLRRHACHDFFFVFGENFWPVCGWIDRMSQLLQWNYSVVRPWVVLGYLIPPLQDLTRQQIRMKWDNISTA